MAQQINLYSPILMAPQRRLSALVMLQAMGFYAVLLIVACAWAAWSSAVLRRELLASTQAQSAERERLAQALALRAPKATSGPALAQELTQLQAGIEQQRRQIDELSRGRVIDGRSHAAILKLIARTVPAPVWLTDLRLLEGRLELTGLTLQPQALRSWLAELGNDPLTAGQRLSAVKVEQSVGVGTPVVGDAWSFTLVNSVPNAEATRRTGAPR